MDNTLIQEKLLLRLTFNPGLALTGFRTTRPWTFTPFTCSKQSCLEILTQTADLKLWFKICDQNLSEGLGTFSTEFTKTSPKRAFSGPLANKELKQVDQQLEYVFQFL